MKEIKYTNPQGNLEAEVSMRRGLRVASALAIVCMMSISAVNMMAQGPRPGDLGSSPLKPGDAGISWYTTWESAKEEAQRSNRPIFFYAAATKCNGVSGVF